MRSGMYLAGVLLVAVASGPSARGGQTYLSLGDSMAFGETVFSSNPMFGPYADPSNGDRGYVSMYADYLGQVNGARPNVVNLAVDGETTSSFFLGAGRVPPGPGFTDTALAELNTHYTGLTPPTQAALLASTLVDQAMAGNVITNVTISLGSNDLFALALTDPNALADLPLALGMFRSTYEALLGSIRSALPNANIALIAPYNPFTALPASPFAPLAGYALPLLNSQIQTVANEFGARYVNLLTTPLTTDAANYTLILNQGDVHPYFDLGYSVIASELIGTPEPSTIVSLGIGLFALAGGAVRSRSRRKRQD